LPTDAFAVAWASVAASTPEPGVGAITSLTRVWSPAGVISQRPAGSTLANQMSVVATYPTAVWLDRMAAIAGGSANGGRLGLQQHVQAALAQQKGAQPIVVELVIYDLPDRDCAALASNGEISIAPNPPTQPLSGIATYEQNYIDPIFNILSAFSTRATSTTRSAPNGRAASEQPLPLTTLEPRPYPIGR